MFDQLEADAEFQSGVRRLRLEVLDNLAALEQAGNVAALQPSSCPATCSTPTNWSRSSGPS